MNSDVKTYYNAHKGDKEYKQSEGRDVTLVKIPVGASVEDLDVINKELVEIKLKSGITVRIKENLLKQMKMALL